MLLLAATFFGFEMDLLRLFLNFLAVAAELSSSESARSLLCLPESLEFF